MSAPADRPDPDLLNPEPPGDLPERSRAPQGWCYDWFTAPDGSWLRYGWAEPARPPRARVVIAPGFGEFAEKYFETIRDLLSAECAVWLLEWQGQGGSQRFHGGTLRQRPMGRAYPEHANDLIAFTQAHVADNAQPGTRTAAPLVLLGHSMGGLIALNALRRGDQPFDRAILSAPMVGLARPGWPHWLVCNLARLMVVLGQGKRYVPGAGDWNPKLGSAPKDRARRVTHDSERARIPDAWMAAVPGLRFGGATWSWLARAYAETGRAQEGHFPTEVAAIPIVMGLAGEDDFVDSDAARRLAEALPEARWVVYPEAYHELFQEHDTVRTPWLAAVTGFAVAGPAGLRTDQADNAPDQPSL